MQKIFKITYGSDVHYLKADSEEQALNAYRAHRNIADTEDVKITSKLAIKQKQELLDNPDKFFLQVLSEQYKNKTKEQLVKEFLNNHSAMFKRADVFDFDLSFQRMVNEMKTKGLENYQITEDTYLSDMVYAIETNRKW